MGVIGVIETVAGALLVAIILVLMLIQIGLRYAPIFNGVWVGEVARFGLVWLTFAVAGYLVSRSEHPVIETIDLVVKGRGRRWVIVGANLVIVIVGIMFVYDGIPLVFNDSTQTTPVLRVPLTLINAVPLIGFALTAIHSLIRAVIFAARLEDEGDNAVGEEGTAFV